MRPSYRRCLAEDYLAESSRFMRGSQNPRKAGFARWPPSSGQLIDRDAVSDGGIAPGSIGWISPPGWFVMFAWFGEITLDSMAFRQDR